MTRAGDSDSMTVDRLPAEIRAARDSVGRFMARAVAPVMNRHEERGEFPFDLVREAGGLGLYAAVFPHWAGGTDMGYLANAVILEEMSRHDVRFASCTNQQGGTCPECIFAAGTDAQVLRFVPGLLSARTIGMMSLSEAGGGSDALGNMKTTARRDGSVYRLSGSKMWATLADVSEVGVLFARTDPDAGAKGVSAFIVEPQKYPGFEARPIPMLGLSKSFRTCAVFLDDFVVPVENRLGEEGEGFTIVMHALKAGRLNVAARALGMAQACLDDALRYLNERHVRGRPIGQFQMIQADLADMVANIEASRLLVYSLASEMDAGRASNRLASIAKHHSAMTVKHAADKTQQFFGAYGWAEEYRISWLKSHADMYFTGEGSANVQRILIAEDALGYKKADRHSGALRFRDPRHCEAPHSPGGADA